MSLHQDRLQSEFKRALSEAIREIKDPRLSKMCSITNVEITKDLKFAKVFISVYDDESARAQSIEVLNNASGMLSRLMSSLISMRRMPHMTFILDDSIEYSVKISKMIDDLKTEAGNKSEQ